MIDPLGDLGLLAADLERGGRTMAKRVGGVLGTGANTIRDEARANVARNLSPRFADAIESRRERSGPPAGYILLSRSPLEDGTDPAAAINAWEDGTALHGPRPSIAPAVERNLDGIIEGLADAAVDHL